MKTLRSALPALLLCAAATSQSQNIAYHDDNSAITGRTNAFPFGATGCRIQQLAPNSVLGNAPALIQDVFIAGALDSGGIYNESDIFYDDFEIRMGTTTSTTLSTTWAANSSNFQTVYRGPLRVRFVRDQWTAIGLPSPYLWLPTSTSDNLVIDFICWSTLDTGAIPPNPSGYFMNVRTSVGGVIPRAYLRNWVSTQPATAQNVDGAGIKLGFLLGDGNFVAHGGGCVGSSGLASEISAVPGTWPQIGGTLDLRVDFAGQNLASFVSLGIDNLTLGGLPLPLGLGSVGAPGCWLWHDSLAVSAGIPTGPTGSASLVLGVPNSAALIGARLYATWFNFDPTANTLGLTTSGYGTIILGT